MRVLYICSYTGLTGASQVMLANIKNLSGKVEFIVILPGHGPLENELRKRGIEVHCLKYFNWMVPIRLRDNSLEKSKWLVKKVVNFLSNVWLMKIIVRSKIDCVQINTLYTSFGSFAAKLLHKKIIWYAQEVPEGASKMCFWNKQKAIQVLNTADCFVCVSNFVRKSIMDYEIPSSKIHVILNSVQTPSNTIEHELFRNKPMTMSLIAGVANKQKNQLFALQVLLNLYKLGYTIKLKFIGITSESDDQEYIQNMENYINVHALADKVEFCGFMDNKDKIYEQTDITISCALDEAFGLTIAESMAYRIPVVAIRSGAIDELLDGGNNGEVCAANDVLEFTRKIEKIINESVYRKQKVANAEKFINEKCNSKTNSNMLLQLYKSV